MVQDVKIITAIYIRVSTEGQKENYSIPYQKDRLSKYCDAMGYSIYNMYIDGGFSGGNMDRPAMQQMLDDAKAGRFQKIIVLKLDRFSRDLLDCYGTLKWLTEDYNIDFLALDDGLDSSNKLVFKLLMAILSIFAEMERDKIKDRLTEGRRTRCQSGLYYGGGKPLGYDYSPEEGLIVNNYEAMQVQNVFNLFLEGNSLNQVCKLMSESYPGWDYYKKVKYVLQNRIYIGEVSYDKAWYKGLHKPIIDNDTFQKAQERLQEIEIDCEYRKTNSRTYLLTGMLWCGVCGERMFVKHSISKGKTYLYYKCYARDRVRSRNAYLKIKACDNRQISIKKLDDIVLNQIRALAIDPSQIDRIAESSNQSYVVNRLDIIQNRIDEINRKIKRYMALYGQMEDLEPTYIKDNVLPLQDEKKLLEMELANTPKLVPIDTSPFKEAALLINNAIEQNDIVKKRNIVNALVSRIVITYDRLDIYWKFSYADVCATQTIH